MIYEFYKYKSIKDFISGTYSKKDLRQYSLPFGNCRGISQESDDSLNFNSRCFKCNFCAFGELSSLYLPPIFPTTSSFFSGEIVTIPSAKLIMNNPYKHFNIFTSEQETKNIQPWVAGILGNTCSIPNRVGMEIPAHNELFDRNGRIDVGIHTNSYTILIETKTTLEDALSDERFVEQHAKYSSCINEYLNKENYLLAIVIGGAETDLLPQTDPRCTSVIGNRSNRFFRLLTEYNIPVISANALWCLSHIKINNPSFEVEKFLQDIFKDPNCLGLLSAGKLVFENNNIKIESIPY